MLFIESLHTTDQMAEMTRRLPALHLFNMTASGKTPPLTAAQAAELGYKLMIFPNFAALAAIRAMAQVLADIRRDGSVANVRDRCTNFADFTALGGLATFQTVEQRFSVISAQASLDATYG